MQLPHDMFKHELLLYLTVHDIVKLDHAFINHLYLFVYLYLSLLIFVHCLLYIMRLCWIGVSTRCTSSRA